MNRRHFFRTLSYTGFLLAISRLKIFGRSSNEIKIKLLATTDVHGAIFPYDLIYDKPLSSSLAQISSYVKKLRTKYIDALVFLDNGDILQGQPTVYYSNFEKINDEHICASVMNYMNYDAATIGNHDIEAGHSVYDKLIKEFNFPWLAANAIDIKTGKPYFKPYTIINRKGVRIAVLGLITPAIPNWLPEKIWEGIEFEDMIESAKKWIKIIKEDENPHLTIGLFHSGTDFSFNNQDRSTTKNENATMIVAEDVPGFDIVIAGHDHNVLKTKITNRVGEEVLLLDPKSYAQYLAEVDISIKLDGNKTIEKTFDGEILKMNNAEVDNEFMALFQSRFDEVKAYVGKPIGEFTSELQSKEALFGNSTFIDLIHTIQFEITKADISFSSPLSFNAVIEKGQVYVRDMFKLYKYENLLYCIMLSGKEVVDYLEYSYGLWFNQMKNENSRLLLFCYDENGNLLPSKYNKNQYQLENPFFNFSSAAGINYEVDLTKPIGRRIKVISMTNGNAFDLNTKYKVAVNSYRGNGGGGHLTFGAQIPKEKLSSRIISSTEKDLRFYMISWIEKQKTVSPIKFNNWKIVPQEWWHKAKKEDIKLLFGE